ncbi:MAG TPA: hypothetical protein VMH83_01845 [Candidatus Acidoferrum sp.]|nr:hypothetical protein [Candidatus Acidoferrum sp.]
MNRLIMTLAITSLVLAVLAYSMLHWKFPRVGFEGAVFFAFAFWVSVLATIFGLFLSFRFSRSNKNERSKIAHILFYLSAFVLIACVVMP